jgi:hypothetical protein
MKDFFEGMFWVILILGIIKFMVSYPAYLRKKKNDDVIDEKHRQRDNMPNFGQHDDDRGK